MLEGQHCARHKGSIQEATTIMAVSPYIMYQAVPPRFVHDDAVTVGVRVHKGISAPTRLKGLTPSCPLQCPTSPPLPGVGVHPDPKARL